MTLLVALFVVLDVDEVKAQPDSRTRYQQGKQALRAGDYRTAIRRFEQAYDLEPHRNILYAIGEAYRRLGQLRQSHAYYSKYAALLPKAERSAFEPKLTRLRFGKPSILTIRVAPQDAEVSIDGATTRLVGGQLQLNINGGHHQLVVSKPGWSTETRDILAEFGEPRIVQIGLQPTRPPQRRPSEQARRQPRETPPPSQPRSPGPAGSAGLSAQLLVGPSFTSYGDAPVDVDAAISVGVAGAYLWRPARRMMIGAQVAAILTPFRDTSIDDSGAALDIYGGLDTRVLLGGRLWIDLQLWAGSALLLGVNHSNFLFGESLSTSSLVVGLALRPALGLIWQPWRWVALGLYPVAFEISPRIGGFSNLATNVTPLVRYQIMASLGLL